MANNVRNNNVSGVNLDKKGDPTEVKLWDLI